MATAQERAAATRAAEDVAMIEAPDRWPRWPRLPVKRWKDGDMQCGLVLAPGLEPKLVGPVVVHEANLWSGPQALVGAPRHEYPSAPAAVAAGWTVD